MDTRHDVSTGDEFLQPFFVSTSFPLYGDEHTSCTKSGPRPPPSLCPPSLHTRIYNPAFWLSGFDHHCHILRALLLLGTGMLPLFFSRTACTLSQLARYPPIAGSLQQRAFSLTLPRGHMLDFRLGCSDFVSSCSCKNLMKTPAVTPLDTCTNHFGAALLGCRNALQYDVFRTVLQPPQESHHSQRPWLRIEISATTREKTRHRCVRFQSKQYRLPPSSAETW